jgi:S-adenosylmethionine:tRNA ribosyltransferase-isomerase
VGAGTFRPVKSVTIGDHPMHQEPFTVTRETLQELVQAEKIVAVGTTSLRTLESLYWLGLKQYYELPGENNMLEQWEAYSLSEKYPLLSYQVSYQALIKRLDEKKEAAVQAFTSLLIAPGYKFNVPHALITNFHQPQSTLLLLIAAFIGKDWKKVYHHALENNYRFLSYGDSSILYRAESEGSERR